MKPDIKAIEKADWIIMRLLISTYNVPIIFRHKDTRSECSKSIDYLIDKYGGALVRAGMKALWDEKSKPNNC